jgi:hypothetical protein
MAKAQRALKASTASQPGPGWIPALSRIETTSPDCATVTSLRSLRAAE